MQYKVCVAMSGGIDSSVTALLLKQQNYIVVGATGIFGDFSLKDVENAKKVCKQIGIDHITIDLKEKFNELIINKSTNLFLNGKTPLPCSFCNRDMKFGEFFTQAMSITNANFFATGHYIKLENGKIQRPSDILKDQTHFFALVRKEIIPYLLFPLADFKKSEIKMIAEEYNLQNNPKESQNLCFLKGHKINTFIAAQDMFNKIPQNLNNNYFVHIKKGKILGTYKDINFYTIGQRQGLGISYTEPLYVIQKDLEKNIIFVGEKKFLYSKEFSIYDINIIHKDYENLKKFKANVCTRALKPTTKSNIQINNNEAHIIATNGKFESVTSGQIATFYDNNNYLIGGGIIV